MPREVLWYILIASGLGVVSKCDDMGGQRVDDSVWNDCRFQLSQRVFTMVSSTV